MSFVIDYTGKVVLVTGVSSGIGLGVAREFARAGAHVAGCSRKPENDASVQGFKQTVESEGVRAFYHQADVTKREDLQAFVEATVRMFGRIDVVVSNAGMNVFEGAAGCSEERWQYNRGGRLFGRALAVQSGPEPRLSLATLETLQALFGAERRRSFAVDDFESCLQLHSGLLPL